MVDGLGYERVAAEQRSELSPGRGFATLGTHGQILPGRGVAKELFTGKRFPVLFAPSDTG